MSVPLMLEAMLVAIAYGGLDHHFELGRHAVDHACLVDCDQAIDEIRPKLATENDDSPDIQPVRKAVQKQRTRQRARHCRGRRAGADGVRDRLERTVRIDHHHHRAPAIVSSQLTTMPGVSAAIASRAVFVGQAGSRTCASRPARQAARNSSMNTGPFGRCNSTPRRHHLG
ncbi:hypothetical protein [Bradyrhizobium sp. USDA 4449]